MSKSKDPLVSVIVIDYKKNNPYLVECLDAIQKQTYKNFEIILVCDYKVSLVYPKLRQKYYGHYVGPAEKRDEGARIAKGEILAFIDDDAFPSKTWLEKIVPHFRKKNITGVGGPGVTPPNVSWQEEASGWASASPVGAGPYLYRFLPNKKGFVEDYPSMNLAVRKTDFDKVGGYDSNFWPGEDTKLCLDLTHKLKKEIIYESKAIVFHHRRPVLWPHLKRQLRSPSGLLCKNFTRYIYETYLFFTVNNASGSMFHRPILPV
jgi:cellulose synthase/poly-beta-1,6-N-acetylglucosamine synthase-like glycosyltransferase